MNKIMALRPILTTETNRRSYVLGLLWLVSCFGLGLLVLQDYFFSTVNTWLAVLLAPVIIRPVSSEKSGRYGWPALFFMVLYIIAPLKTLYFLGWGFALLFLVEMHWGKTNWMALFLMFLASSFANYAFSTFGFEIRLLLSEYGAHVLSWFYSSAVSTGNEIILNGAHFRVDPACIGLNSMATSFCIALFALSYFERKMEKKIQFLLFAILMLITLLLIVFSNFMRILILVMLKSAPETFSHDAIGMFGLVFYVGVPIFLISKWMVKRWARPQKPLRTENIHSSAKTNWVYKGLLCALAIALSSAPFVPVEKIWNQPTLQPQQVDTFERSIEKFNVAKYSREDVLMYIKPPVPFYSADHNPTICWRGSGYQMQYVREVKSGSQSYFMAELVYRGGKMHDNNDKKAPSHKLYTAWWFDNGTIQTINQWKWRWYSAIGNSNFHLVNVTMEKEEALIQFMNSSEKNLCNFNDKKL